MKVPLAKTFYNNKLKSICDNILESGFLVNGENVKNFEIEWANFCNQKYSIAVNSGTFAILSVLSSFNLEKGDEIILPSNTFVATALPLSFLGLKPKFIDINIDDYCINPDLIKENITDRTKAIIAVDLYGCPAEMDVIQKIAKENNLFVLEDACQSHGSQLNENPPGYYADATVYSFYPSKNLSVLGEGGMITTNNEKISKSSKCFRNYGRVNSDDCGQIGFNGVLSEIHAALGSYQIQLLNNWNNKRIELANIYHKRLMEFPGEQIIRLPRIFSDRKCVYHLFVIRVKEREALVKYLNEKGVQARVHYKIPVHKQSHFKDYNKIKLPITEQVCKEVISLPISQFLTGEEINYVIDCIQNFYREN